MFFCTSDIGLGFLMTHFRETRGNLMCVAVLSGGCCIRCTLVEKHPKTVYNILAYGLASLASSGHIQQRRALINNTKARGQGYFHQVAGWRVIQWLSLIYSSYPTVISLISCGPPPHPTLCD